MNTYVRPTKWYMGEGKVGIFVSLFATIIERTWCTHRHTMHVRYYLVMVLYEHFKHFVYLNPPSSLVRSRFNLIYHVRKKKYNNDLWYYVTCPYNSSGRKQPVVVARTLHTHIHIIVRLYSARNEYYFNS